MSENVYIVSKGITNASRSEDLLMCEKKGQKLNHVKGFKSLWVAIIKRRNENKRKARNSVSM
jgi:hypothetical protein